MDSHKILIRDYGVSRETLQKLEIYCSLLKHWQKITHLVAPSELERLWKRHILDSIQLMKYIDSGTQHIVDIGSGGGFPGLVLAILGIEKGWNVSLVDSNSRKVAFLKAVSRETGARASVYQMRFEDFVKNYFDSNDKAPEYITARAVADLKTLVALSMPFLSKGSVALFHKGKGATKEIESIEFKVHCECLQSITDKDASIIRVQDIQY